MILVTGATGNIGSVVLDRLIEAGQKVRVLARDPAKLSKVGGAAEVVKGDLASPETLDAAFAGADKAFVVATGPDITKLAINAFDAAEKAGVKHVVFISSSAVNVEPPIAIGRWHQEAEAKLKASGMAWTILRPGAFASNALQWTATIKAQGAVYMPTGEGKSAPIDPRDIADVAATALLSPGHEGKEYELSGPEALSMAEQVEKIGAAVGQPLRFVDVPADMARGWLVRAGLPEAIVDAMLEALAITKAGHGWTVTSTVEQVLGRKARTFDAWVADNAAAFKSEAGEGASAPQDRQFPEWGQLYRDQSVEGMPWYYEPLDPDLENALVRYGMKTGEGLDIGSGPGTQAMALAARGYRMTGTDLAEAAVELAAAKARERGLVLEFKTDDILQTKLSGPFDFAFDRGCFHVLPVASRADYVRTVAGLLRSGGYLFLKTFSTLEPGFVGPHRFSADDIRSIFGEAFEVLSTDATVYQGTREPEPRALFSVLRKL
jgi:uncharacterized protein YbjT (DUF2867 family)/2-polyprenyl-3-methyl-5-hydroxy-6-metoxy-1,4-benzoquinol methylase